jgi:tetratricopeptide (TPR) repeat protein
MDRSNANSPSPGSGHNDERSRDYPALCVFVGLLVALLAAGYFALKNLDMNSGFRPGPYVREWINDLEGEVKDLLDQATQGREITGRESADAKTHLLKGYRLHRQRSYTEALEELNKAVDLDPRNAEAYYWRGRTQMNLGRLDQGVDDFKKAVNFKPDYSEAYDHLGWLAAKQGQVNEAIDYLTKSVEFKPENGWAFYNRSRLFFRKGDVANAMKDAEKACSLGYQDGCKAYETYKNSPKEGG